MKTKLTDWPFFDPLPDWEEDELDYRGNFVMCVDIHIDGKVFRHLCGAGSLN